MIDGAKGSLFFIFIFFFIFYQDVRTNIFAGVGYETSCERRVISLQKPTTRYDVHSK